MSTTLQSIIEEFTEEDQKFIQSKASDLAEEMIRHTDSMAEVRTALLETHEEVARKPAARAASKTKVKGNATGT